MTPDQRQELQTLQAETLAQKHKRLVRAKQAACPHTNIDEMDGFVWCADCDFDII